LSPLYTCAVYGFLADAKHKTCKSYDHYVRLYTAWVEMEGYDLYSISKIACARFFIEVAQHPTLNHGKHYAAGTICSTMRGAVASIYTYRDWKPHQSGEMTDAIAEIKKMLPSPLRKNPLPIKALHDLVMKTCSAAVSKRDTLIFILMTLGFLRPGELLALNVGDVWFDAAPEHGTSRRVLVIRICKSKGDQAGRGETVILGEAPNSRICPVAWFSIYCAAFGLPLTPPPIGAKKKPLFTASPASPKRMSTKGLAVLFAERLPTVGLSPSDFTPHCCRVGGATAAAAAGIDQRVIMRHGRWKSDAVYVYIHESWHRRLEIGDAIC
jgi:integrase